MFIDTNDFVSVSGTKTKSTNTKNEEKKFCVIKFGGALADDMSIVDRIAAQSWELWHTHNILPVIVHGGGNQIDAALREAGIPIRRDIVTNERITDRATLEVCDATLGRITGDIVERFNAAADHWSHGQAKAVGVSGYHRGLVFGRFATSDQTDFTGLVTHARVRPILHHLRQKNILIVNPMSLHWNANRRERRLNMNADDVALALAVALGAEKVVFCSNVPGVKGDCGKLIHTLSSSQAHALIDQRVICGGMIPKVQAAIKGADLLCGGSAIVDGSKENAIYDALVRSQGGTRIVGKAATGSLHS